MAGGGEKQEWEKELSTNIFENQKREQDEDKEESKTAEREDKQTWGSAKSGRHGDFRKSDLYCVEQTGSRSKRGARGTGKIFENLTWLTADEAAEYLRLPSVGMLRVLVCKREVPFHKLGRRLRFKKMDLDRLLESSRKGGI